PEPEEAARSGDLELRGFVGAAPGEGGSDTTRTRDCRAVDRRLDEQTERQAPRDQPAHRGRLSRPPDEKVRRCYDPFTGSEASECLRDLMAVAPPLAYNTPGSECRCASLQIPVPVLLTPNSA